MGYTHYWSYKEVASNDSISKILDEIKKLLNENNLMKLITSEDLNIVPIFNKELILFNGIEQFAGDIFLFDFTEPNEYIFCKTNRKPYDIIVSLVLLSLSNNIHEFTFSSDGTLEDWNFAIYTYEKYIRSYERNDIINNLDS
jgi:nitric oxide synthase oxygenase domain/subunit